MKRTKIIATIGPATEQKTKIRQLKEAGANAFRINMSHGDPQQWKGFIDSIREICDDSPIILDTRGPEIRLLGVTDERALKQGERLHISQRKHAHKAYFSHALHVSKNDPVLIDDGNIETIVDEVNDTDVTLRVTKPSLLTNRRKVSIPRTQKGMPILTAEDKKDIQTCASFGVDGYAISFTRSARDIKTVRALVGETPFLIAKIENQEGVENIDEIIREADAVMVARGDLGVEIPLADVPHAQKIIIKRCNEEAKPVIVATQMLSSMRTHNRPTRAEVSDVANAILDGADCVMLSDETAAGNYPVESVQTMAEIARKTEPYLSNPVSVKKEGLSIAESVTNSAYEMAVGIGVRAIVISTTTGKTARMISRHRPNISIIAVAHDVATRRRLQLSWGVTAITFAHNNHNGTQTIFESVRVALEKKLLTKKDVIVATAGVKVLQEGLTNLIEVHTVEELFAYHDRLKKFA